MNYFIRQFRNSHPDQVLEITLTNNQSIYLTDIKLLNNNFVMGVNEQNESAYIPLNRVESYSVMNEFPHNQALINNSIKLNQPLNQEQTQYNQSNIKATESEEHLPGVEELDESSSNDKKSEVEEVGEGSVSEPSKTYEENENTDHNSDASEQVESFESSVDENIDSSTSKDIYSENANSIIKDSGSFKSNEQ
ncbi:hypothetical protein [Alkalibacillus aidingensis]|uniref:hypothetical protein n=1 Tax=Alkalibacillus aidingensis TaxID=2747607 RepID=UPI0016601094|nr:hypothetical protein [Alkalibacillus aidingensis]